jgi:predicted CxxxxCH...CXXCH cytochrome family protein
MLRLTREDLDARPEERRSGRAAGRPARDPRLAFAVALGFALAACGEARTPVDAQGPTTPEQRCATCHGTPPPKDAHLAHGIDLSGSSAPGALPHAPIKCLQCHPDVQDPNQPGHIFDAQGKPLPPPAVVRFDDPAAIAGRTQPGASRAGAPAYDPVTRTCSNVYCHGSGLKAPTSDVVSTPAWNAPQGSIGCGRCHGIPPADHAPALAMTDCHRCHGDAIDASGVLDPVRHIDGNVDLTAGASTSAGSRDAATGAPIPPRPMVHAPRPPPGRGTSTW